MKLIGVGNYIINLNMVKEIEFVPDTDELCLNFDTGAHCFRGDSYRKFKSIIELLKDNEKTFLQL